MNREDVLAELKRLLGRICVSEFLIEELHGLIAETGVEAAVFSLLVTRLRMLAVKGVQVTQLKEFEPIGNGLYSMHLAGPSFNIRILFAFLPTRQPALLLAFYERAGKRKTDYSSHIGPAIARLNAIKENYQK